MNPADISSSVAPLTSSNLSLFHLFWHAHWIVESVMAGLLENGTYQNVFYGDNLRAVAEPDSSGNVFVITWWYRTEFTVAEGAGGIRTLLRINGMIPSADVWLNGNLVAEQATALFFEEVAAGRDAKAAAHWVTGDLFAALNRLGIGIEQSPVSPGQLGGLIDLIVDGTISGRLAKDVFAEMVTTGVDPATIVEKKGLRQVTDESAIAAAVDAVLAAQADKVAEYRAGRDKLYGFFVGQVMRVTQGKANPTLVNELLKKKLSV